LVTAGFDTVDQRLRRRQALAEQQPLVRLVERRNVDECAANIGRYA
jgi:hypothetical protein